MRRNTGNHDDDDSYLKPSFKTPEAVLNLAGGQVACYSHKLSVRPNSEFQELEKSFIKNSSGDMMASLFVVGV